MTTLIKERRRRTLKIPGYKPTASKLLEAICDVLGESIEDVTSNSRKGNLVKARAIYCYMGRMMRYKNRELAACLHKNTSNTQHHVRLYTYYMDDSKPWFRPELKEEIDTVRRRIQSRLNYCE